MREVNHCHQPPYCPLCAERKHLYLEDLSGIRQTSKQRKKNRSDAGVTPGRTLETKLSYMALTGRQAHKRRAAYTSKSDHRTGRLDGKRNRHKFTGADVSDLLSILRSGMAFHVR